jgi:hypothetical protein
MTGQDRTGQGIFTKGTISLVSLIIIIIIIIIIIKQYK